MRKLNYRIVGQGPRTVFMVHGLLGSSRNLQSLARSWLNVEPDLCIFLPDLPGHGESPPLDATDNLASLADNVVFTAASVELNPPYRWLGHSLGGRIGLAALAKHAARLESIELLDIGPSPITSDLDRVLAALVAAPAHPESRTEAKAHLTHFGLSEFLAEWLLMNMHGTPPTWRIDRTALLEFHARTHGLDLWSHITHATVPIRCLKGADSEFVTVADIKRLRALGCEVQILPNAGHFLHITAREEVVQWLIQATKKTRSHGSA